jgi:hypothetical protein
VLTRGIFRRHSVVVWFIDYSRVVSSASTTRGVCDWESEY